MRDYIMSLHFPDYFPANCPPEKASDKERTLFRLCKNSTLNEDDFVSYYEENPSKFKNKVNAYGLSAFPSEQACWAAMDKSPNLRAKYSYVAFGKNTPERGKTLDTPNGTSPQHITWWVYDGVKPHTFFKVCDEGGGHNE